MDWLSYHNKCPQQMPTLWEWLLSLTGSSKLLLYLFPEEYRNFDDLEDFQSKDRKHSTSRITTVKNKPWTKMNNWSWDVAAQIVNGLPFLVFLFLYSFLLSTILLSSVAYLWVFHPLLATSDGTNENRSKFDSHYYFIEANQFRSN